MLSLNRSLTVLKSAKTGFFLLGFAIAAWAPLVPYIQARLEISKFTLSLMILSMGIGSIAGMLFSPFVVKKQGTRFSVLFSGIALALSLIFVAAIPGFILQFFLIFVYGFTMGLMEVSVNLYASVLEKKYKKPLMSVFHGFYSVGQIFAVLSVAFLLSCNFSPFIAVTVPTAFLVFLFALTGKLIEASKVVSDEPLLVIPKGVVIVLAVIALFALTAEGAAIDWVGLLLLDKQAAEPEIAASGYLTVVIFMAAGRFLGGRILQSIGSFKTLIISVLLAGFTLTVISFSLNPFVIYISLGLLGLSLSNILPVAVSFAGRQKAMPQSAAVAAVTTCGYAAITFGPFAIGSIGSLISLSGAFAVLGVLIILLGFFLFIKKAAFNF